MRERNIVSILLGMVMAVVFAGCSVIDEDLSDCDEALKLDYDLHLVTNMSIELQHEFDRLSDANLLKALQNYLDPIFTDYGRDLDLSFYDVEGDHARLHHEQHQMEANEMSYTLYIPRRPYNHLALANLEGNGVVTLEGSEFSHTSGLLQSRGDTVRTHKTGLFSARKKILADQDDTKSIDVHLYMVNCAAGLVIDTSEADLKDLKVFARGFASGFNIADSSFVFSAKPQTVIADEINTGNPGQKCFCTVNFPSRETPEKTRVIFVTEDPFKAKNASDAVWEFIVHATLPDGTVTQSILGVWSRLRSGQLKMLHGKMNPDGSLSAVETNVGVSVTLDWSPAGHHEVPL